ncbi:MAG: rhomboid family intramembrane serine protease [Bacilli bacterium]|nr:rhomboid family intramembrane serine protease [Bacilli bacterium]
MNIEQIHIMDYLEYNSFVTLTLFFISLGILILDKIFFGVLTKYIFSTERASLLNPLTYVRFFTHILGHADWNHLSNNYLKILLLGPLIEEKYGSMNFFIMIMITAFVVGIANFIKGKTCLKGASSIAFMMIILSAFVNITENKIPITLVLIIIFYVVDEMVALFKKDNVAHDAHLVGGICGLVFGFVCTNQSIMDYISNFINKF